MYIWQYSLKNFTFLYEYVIIYTKQSYKTHKKITKGDAMTLIERIGKYVDEIAPGQPILAGDIYTHVAKAGFTQRDVFNEYLTRYLDTHPDFLRYRRGI